MTSTPCRETPSQECSFGPCRFGAECHRLEQLAEEWHDSETLGGPDCEHRLLELAAFKAGFRAALSASNEDVRDARRYRALRNREDNIRLNVSDGNNPFYGQRLDDAVDASLEGKQ